MPEEVKLVLKEVNYTRTINTGNFQNIRLGASASVQDGEDGADVLDRLITFINDKAKEARLLSET